MDSAAKPRRQGVATYVFTVLAIAAATILIALVPPLVQRGAFVVYLAVVALVTWFGGWRPGILAIALAACAAAIYVLPPPNSFWVTDWADVLRAGGLCTGGQHYCCAPWLSRACGVSRLGRQSSD